MLILREKLAPLSTGTPYPLRRNAQNLGLGLKSRGRGIIGTGPWFIGLSVLSVGEKGVNLDSLLESFLV